MNRVIFMLEGKSEKEFLDILLPRFFPDLKFLCIQHEGKQDLEKSIPRKLRGWKDPEDCFVILRDKDTDDCRTLKASLVRLCQDAGRPDALVRIACHELEAWYLGDPDALAEAFKKPDLGKIRGRRKFRTPDAIQDPVNEVMYLCPAFQKVSGARAVAKHLSYTRNISSSFRVFIEGLARVAHLSLPEL
ncbi:DUF4276 family protein [Pararhodospirillum oryzae]|uniref:DUF4276 family protein n=1 Tax=Pararhodospirillum oryzae TaxID=478448 RepID=A0A512H4X8_9PROT|nr:DUF4276 family protein [Pararhodospirillum oryzae]GEO80474.1 hypothetical protein ROR02_06050 [Pararhodospirillum oryzae]